MEYNSEGVVAGWRRMGLASTAAMSRHLQALEAELPRTPARARLLAQAVRQLRTVQPS